MPRRFFKQYLPSQRKLQDDRFLRLLGKTIFQPNLWHINRRSLPRAFAVGLFWAMFPMPFQMFPAALCAVWCRANMGFSIALVWISNPLTMGPMWYGTYHFGRLLLGLPPSGRRLEFTWDALSGRLGEIWLPLYVGSLTAGLLLGGLGYLLTRWWWTWHVHRRWRRRRPHAPSPA